MIPAIKKSTDQAKWKRAEDLNLIDNEATGLIVQQSLKLQGQVAISGAKNAVLVIMASLILCDGKSILRNVPASTDVLHMISVLEFLGATVFFDMENHILQVDSSSINSYTVDMELMKKMRASVLVAGPLLVRFGRADIALPGGCSIGPRPIDFHLKNFARMGIEIKVEGDYVHAFAKKCVPTKIVLEYPSVGATENILMTATLTKGKTIIVNASLEPEVIDLIAVLKKMGAHIHIENPATIEIEGVSSLKPIDHTVMMDRLEVGGLLLASAITGGNIYLPEAQANHLEVFLEKLTEMGHSITCEMPRGIRLKATLSPKAVSFRTAPFPGFPTDLQAPMIAALALAEGDSIVHETVFENRFLHIRELQKMGAQIEVNGDRARIRGVERLYGTSVIASDIRASCALVLAGLAAQGSTTIIGIHHWRRGYENLENKLKALGAKISLKTSN
ncbi:MAG: UDP-N-acetylglucosamine 1-carboxyvinyltransferase [Candidatus Babeliales bacterium]